MGTLRQEGKHNKNEYGRTEKRRRNSHTAVVAGMGLVRLFQSQEMRIPINNRGKGDDCQTAQAEAAPLAELLELPEQ